VTPLQRETSAILDRLYGARERLAEVEYLAFTATLQEALARELARLALGEALAATREAVRP
jgi:hypothetical protein